MAINRLENLLASNPEERLILPAKYNLYQLYEAERDAFNSDKYKFDILQNYSDTRYASIIKNPNTALEQDNDSPEAVYNNLYRQYENQQYEVVIAKSQDYIGEFAGDAFVPKFELLKALATGKLKGFDAYQEALNYVALSYPNQEEGKQAKELLEKGLPAVKNTSFIPNTEAFSFKLIYPYSRNNRLETLKVKDSAETFLIENSRSDLKVSLDVYDETTEFLVFHGFVSASEALIFSETLNREKRVALKEDEPVIVNSQNYRTIQIHKNLQAYKNLETK